MVFIIIIWIQYVFNIFKKFKYDRTVSVKLNTTVYIKYIFIFAASVIFLSKYNYVIECLSIKYTPKILTKYLLECRINNKIIYGYGLNTNIITDAFYIADSVKKSNYCFDVHQYVDKFGKPFKKTNPFAHPIIVVNDFINIYPNVNIGLQCTKNPHLSNNFNLLSDIAINGKPTPQYISNYLIFYNTELLKSITMETLSLENINLFLTNKENYRELNLITNNGFNYPNIIIKL